MKLKSYFKETTAEKDPRIINWRENNIGQSLYYSYRVTHYNRLNFPSRLHQHDYFELVIFEEGDVHYICDSHNYRPETGDILLIPPGTFHMSAIQCENTLYKRHVFYLYQDALNVYGCGALTDFLKTKANGVQVLTLEEGAKAELFSLLSRLDQSLMRKEDRSYEALAIGLVIQIFFLLKGGSLASDRQCAQLPQRITAIKSYIDEHFLEVSSVNDVAAHFFYSREYVSRLFRKHFNTTVSDYVKAKRISHCRFLIERGASISDACFQSGFENMSTFIRSFRAVVGMTPSEYRKELTKKA